MLLVLASNLTAECLERVSRHIAQAAVVLPAADTATALDIARRLPVSVVIAGMDPLTTARLAAYAQLAEALPDAIFCCLASQAVKEQVKTEESLQPDFWLDPEAASGEMADGLSATLDKARLKARVATSVPPATELQPATQPSGHGPEQGVFHRLMAALAGQPEPDRLLHAYLESATQLVRCATYCLLMRDPLSGHLVVKAAQGLHPQIVAHGRLLPSDALLTWYDRNCRILTIEELDSWPDPLQATEMARELKVFRGQVVLPLVVAGGLEGLLILGEKALGEPYTRTELETLFSVTGHVSVQLDSVRQQQQHDHVVAHMDRSISAMNCGLITLGPDQRIVVCNPAAAAMLQVPQQEIEGADLRSLPSPLGDRLYAALTSQGAAVTGEKVQLPRLGIWLSISTFRLMHEDGRAAGSIMVLQDITDSLAEQARTTQQASMELLTDLVGRITHSVRTPLTAIKTYGQLLNQGQPAGELADFWHHTVAAELERLDHLLTQLVQLVQQPEPDLQLVDMESLLIETIRNVSGTDTELRPAPVLRIATPVPRAVVDPSRTRDALSHLFRYLQSLDDSPVIVFVDQQQDDNGVSARIRLRKSAEAADVAAEQLFDPLQALRQPHADLGLVISRQIVESQAGTIQARNEDGNIEVTIAFPLAVRDTVDISEATGHGQTEDTGDRRRGWPPRISADDPQRQL